MRKNNLTRGAFALMLLASTAAGADQQYPAADFQPEVLYQDTDYIAKGSQSSTKTDSHKSTPVASSPSTEVDSKYPAANFQPEVLYHDADYKPSGVSTKSSASSEVTSKSEKSVESEEVVASSSNEESASSNKAEPSFTNYLFGIVVLLGAGFYLFRKSNAGKVCTKSAKNSAPAATVKKSYALNTGVAKYLNKVSGTGVSRYIETQVKSATVATGVAKYLAKQTVASKPAKAATGVEKYMRDRG